MTEIHPWRANIFRIKSSAAIRHQITREHAAICGSPFALARTARSPHIKEMREPHTEFEPIQLKDYSGWQVLITLSRGEQHRISSFKTEAEARTWIGENSDTWLRTYTGDAFV
jgi:hypothetical protein